MSAPKLFELDLSPPDPDPAEPQSSTQLELFSGRPYSLDRLSAATIMVGRKWTKLTRETLSQANFPRLSARTAVGRRVVEAAPASEAALPPDLDQDIQATTDRLERYLGRPGGWALMTGVERETLIGQPQSYFRKINQLVAASHDHRPGQLDRLHDKQRRIIRETQARLSRAYTVWIIDSLLLVDSCRGWWRYLNQEDFQPIRLADRPDSVKRRVSAGLADLLMAARRENLVVGNHRWLAAQRLQRQLDAAGLDSEPAARDAARRLTVLVGKNAGRRAEFWRDRVLEISDGGRAVDPAVPALLRDYDRQRRTDYRQRFDPLVSLWACFDELTRESRG